MLRSMTAYGRAVHDSPLGRFVVELQSVNRKHFELKAALPPELVRFEADIKGWVTEKVSRGLLTVRIAAHYHEAAPTAIVANLPLARQAKAAWDEIAQVLNENESDESKSGAFSLSLLKDLPGIFDRDDSLDLEDEEKYRAALEEAVKAALIPYLEMGQREAAALKGDFLQHIASIRQQLSQIRELAPASTEKMRGKLKERLGEILPSTEETDERLLRELALFAEKVDISEEIERLTSHIDQFIDSLDKGGPSGKRLDFICQEMMRESNTICSKSADVALTRCAVEIKVSLERIREQVQNVE